MKLIGVIKPDRPLLVVALEEEAAHLDGALPVLLTGLGKVNAAAGLAAALGRGNRPSTVVNLGTAGALRPGWHGTHEVSRVHQHDLDTAFLYLVTAHRVGLPMEIADDGPALATGDVFVSDEAARARLAAHADLADMEGYAVASVARQFDVPIRIVKHISDDAGEDASRTWREAVDDCAQNLASWTKDHL
ncbi:nucleosidase [Streptomyces sp. H27-C3]|uniref:nucleosidase n=1 Tax=Streptomyces sp. H27-C3 TaxID=3046305 RepID=UPI0024B9301C|nr:nucleosidase [Streptomyces sp. H27-C3]MDJ0466220.1 nucleosidase [Streptomyces sp. H27-C3]